MTVTNVLLKNSISYLTNDKGEKTAIVFDLKVKAVRDLVEDLLDTLTAIERQNEPRTSIEDAMKEILD
jgi:hypothetical protein